MRIQQIHHLMPIAVSGMHRSDHMRATVGSLVNHRHSNAHRPAPHVLLNLSHTTHPPGPPAERHLQPSRIPISTGRPRHKLPVELQRIMKRHKRLQAIHLETHITREIIGPVRPLQEPIPSPQLSPAYRLRIHCQASIEQRPLRRMYRLQPRLNRPQLRWSPLPLLHPLLRSFDVLTHTIPTHPPKRFCQPRTPVRAPIAVLPQPTWPLPRF